jgi:hypothetical protein
MWRMVQHQNPPPAPPGVNRTHQSRGAGAQNDYVEWTHGRPV